MSPLEPVRPSLCRRLWAGARLAAGAAIVVALVWRLGSGPFLAGLRSISVGSLLVASAIAVLTTVGAAWRWCLVARGLGAGLGLRTAVAAYYRSQFLNSVLPGGVLGDLHRGVSHGGQVGDVGRGLRAVGWERSAGQVVQVGVALAVLLALPSPVRGSVPYLIAALVGAALVAVLLARAPRGGSAGPGRLLGALRTDLRTGVLAQRSWPGILVSSVVVVGGHTATFLYAAYTAGVVAPTAQLLPLALAILLAMAVPTNIGGWGPREGVAAWLFAAVGLGAAQGIATATVYGVLTLVATLPGGLVLLASWVQSRGVRAVVPVPVLSRPVLPLPVLPLPALPVEEPVRG